MFDFASSLVGASRGRVNQRERLENSEGAAILPAVNTKSNMWLALPLPLASAAHFRSKTSSKLLLAASPKATEKNSN